MKKILLTVIPNIQNAKESYLLPVFLCFLVYKYVIRMLTRAILMGFFRLSSLLSELLFGE